MTIRKKFIIFSVLLGVVPAIILTGIYIKSFMDKGMELVKQNLITSANDQSVHLEAFFERYISNLNANSNTSELRELLTTSNSETNLQNQKENIKELEIERKKDSFLISKLLFNKEGMVIATTDNIQISERMLISREQIDRLENNEVVITNIIENSNFNNGIKSAIIARPVFFDNKYQGAIASAINMDYFENLASRVHYFKTGSIAVIDENGLVAGSNNANLKGNIANVNITSNLYSKWRNIDFKNNPNGIINFNVNGIEKIGYYSKINDVGWIIMSDVELGEFKEPIDKSIRDIILFFILILAITISSYAFTANYFSRPIDMLLRAIREIKKGNYKDRFVYTNKNEFGEIATAFNELIDTIEENKKHIESRNRELQSLTSNIPGGVHRNVLIDGEHYIDFFSCGCLKIIGYEEDELKHLVGRKASDIVYEKDRERVKKEIKEQIDKDNKFTVEYRVKRKDGSIIWLLDNGRIIKDRSGKTFSYNVAINITDAKLAQEELRLSEERYRIVTSQTDDIIFEWNVLEDRIYYSGNFEGNNNIELISEEVTKNIYKLNHIHEDDMKVFREMLNYIIKGEQYREIEIRMKKNTGEYIWCKIRISAIFDINGDICRAIGVIRNIDKEKKEAEELLFKAQRDSLTGLYNKKTTEELIEEYIKQEATEGKGALFQIDLDNFKAINDNLGHLAGDFVLTNMSSMLLEIFSENSIIGRIGGDEFIVFLKNVTSEDVIYRKAEQLVLGFRTNFTKEFLNYKLSGSIGIAKYPEHGAHFESLYLKADKATYLAKSKGKDNYCIFEEK